jgi:TRAP-type C4-dicarboxylate transport system permease small subunit
MEDNLNIKKYQPSSKGLLASIVHCLDIVVNPTCKYGAYISAFMLAALMFLTFIDTIFGRLGKWSLINSQTNFFGPIVGSQEVSELLMLVFIVFALAYCAREQGHIRVDLILQHVSPKANLGFDIIANFFSFIFYIFITWQAIQFGLDNIRDKSVTTILTIPHTPFNFILAVGAALVALVFLRDFLKSIKEVTE